MYENLPFFLTTLSCQDGDASVPCRKRVTGPSKDYSYLRADNELRTQIGVNAAACTSYVHHVAPLRANIPVTRAPLLVCLIRTNA